MCLVLNWRGAGNKQDSMYDTWVMMSPPGPVGPMCVENLLTGSTPEKNENCLFCLFVCANLGQVLKVWPPALLVGGS